VAVRRVPLVRSLSVPTDLRAVVVVRALLKSERPRLLHTHMAKAGTVGRMAAVSLGRRRPVTVHTFHGHVLDSYFRPAVERSFLEVERRLARHTDALVTVSPEIRDQLLDLRIGRADQYRVIALGLPLQRFFDARPGGLRERLGIGSDVPLVGAVGRLVPVKDLGTLLEAVALLDGVHVALVGDGESRLALEDKAAALGLDGRAHFTGWWDDVAGAFAELDVVALSSVNEGTPVALIEALAAARPVVATAVGGVAHVVEDGVTGLLVPKEDPAALAARLDWALRHRDEMAALAATGSARMRERFHSERLVADVRGLYRELLGA
jgi:glycosyltransferase involved in cell wall biosynthesis